MSFSDILNELAQDKSRRISAKVPQWAGIDGLEFPTLLCTEQCSSSEAAFLKAEAARELLREARPGSEDCAVADLTGGIGVDSWAFSRSFSHVLHNEKDSALSKAAERNFRILGADGIEISNCEVNAGNAGAILDAFFFRYDCPRLVYLDPARRSSGGEKVFRIKDCTPNILELLPVILKDGALAIVKLSPMADIDRCVIEIEEALGHRAVREVRCIGVNGECKELLFLLDAENDTPVRITVRDGGFRFSFTREEESAARATFPQEGDMRGWLFEPGAALAKSGGFKLLSERFSLVKMAVSTQLYLSGEFIPELADAGRWFSVIEALPFCNESLRRISRDCPRCEVSSRNLPVRSDELRKRLDARSGGDIHIFGLLAETAAGPERLLLVCRKR